MRIAASMRPAVVLALLLTPLAGCGGSSGREEGPPTAPVITSANQDQLAKDVNAGAGVLAKGAPGVKK